MRKNFLSILMAAAALTLNLWVPSLAYPERPESARVQYELWYFPYRLTSMVVTTLWDVPTGCFVDTVRGAVGGTKCVARNLGKEDGPYELVAGSLTGGPIGAGAGAVYGVFHGFAYGMHHGFVGYPSPHSGSHSMIFQGKGFVVPYDDNY